MQPVRANVLVLIALGVVVCLPCALRVASTQEPSRRSALVVPTPAPPLSDARIPVQALVREDLFAGYLENDMKRFARGEKSIELLMDSRPFQRANLLAWKGSATLYRAVRACESHHDGEYRRDYKEAMDLFAQAGRFKTANEEVNGVIAGSYALFVDRLPATDRPAAYERAYEAFQTLWKDQAPFVDKLPVHDRGELMGGLAKFAAGTGHLQESNRYLDQMLMVLRDTPYEAAARQWKENPNAVSHSPITCLSCHDPGRLAARLSVLNGK